MNLTSLMQSALQAALPHSATTVLDTRNLRDLRPDVLDADGNLRILPASYWRGTTQHERALLGHHTALYGLPTLELVAWIKDYIGGRSAIEIGAAHGLLAQALGIPATDSYQQADPAMAAYYALMGQATVRYGAHVERLDALQAVAKHRPQVVVASWVTHKYLMIRNEAGGNAMGVDEEALLDSGIEAYVFIGNSVTHKHKSIWTRPHRFIEQDFVYSRAAQPGAQDFLCVWERPA